MDDELIPLDDIEEVGISNEFVFTEDLYPPNNSIDLFSNYLDIAELF